MASKELDQSAIDEKLWTEFRSLPPAAQQEVADFIAFLAQRTRPRKPRRQPRTSIATEPFVGMWRDREDMKDSTAWVRDVRRRHWPSWPKPDP